MSHVLRPRLKEGERKQFLLLLAGFLFSPASEQIVMRSGSDQKKAHRES